MNWLHRVEGKPPAGAGRTRLRAGSLLAAGFLVPLLLFVPSGLAQEAKPPAEAKPTEAAKPAEDAKPAAEEAQPAGPATYVGNDSCQICHEDIFKAFSRNPHHVLDRVKSRGWEGKSCESCHGPGSRHAESASAEDIQNPAKLSGAKASQLCLKCHLQQPNQINHIQNSHARNLVSCVGCHTMHKPGPGGTEAGFAPRKAAAVNAQCATCHTAVWAEFQRPHAHRLPQGAMSCVDCHNPHGSVLANSIRTVRGNEPACLQCHGDKRGPFVFEHAPMRQEGCQACHEPHGSPNPRMLTRSQVHLVCLECHSNLPSVTAAPQQALGGIPPAFHDLRTARFRNCTVCHVKVHGSYVNRALLR